MTPDLPESYDHFEREFPGVWPEHRPDPSLSPIRPEDLEKRNGRATAYLLTKSSARRERLRQRSRLALWYRGLASLGTVIATALLTHEPFVLLLAPLVVYLATRPGRTPRVRGGRLLP